MFSEKMKMADIHILFYMYGLNMPVILKYMSVRYVFYIMYLKYLKNRLKLKFFSRILP